MEPVVNDKTIRAKALVFVVLALLLGLWAVPVSAQSLPPLPHSFYGSVAINGEGAPAGTVVTAKFGATDCGTYTVRVAGQYGDRPNSDYIAVTCRGLREGDAISFYVNGGDTTQTASFVPGGGPTELNLSVTTGITAPAGTTTPTTGGSPTSVAGRISRQGIMTQSVTAESEDGVCRLTIDSGTEALDKEGNPLSQVTVVPVPEPPSLPGDTRVVGLTYDFGPDGATFVPPITLELGYDPAAIPDGVAEENLDIAYYDEDIAKWVELESTVDTATKTVTAFTSHFTAFAILGYKAVAPSATAAPAAFTLGSLTISPTEVDIGETVAIRILITNTGGQPGNYKVVLKVGGEVETTKEVTVAAGVSKEVSFSTVRDVAGTYSLDVGGLTGSFTVREASVLPAPSTPARASVNWLVVSGIIAAVVVIGLLVFSLVRRRA